MANTDNSTAIITQNNRRVLEGYPFVIDCGVLGENNLDRESGGIVVTWYKDGTSLSTGLSYSVEKPTQADTGTYYFTATNAFGTTTSDSVDVEIVTPSPSQFGPNLVQNGMAENGLSGWTPQLGSIKLKKFWGKSGDHSWVGYKARFPDPGGIDPLYAHRDGLAFFTAQDHTYRMSSGNTHTFIKENPGGNLTTAYQDVFITDPTTLDIIDRKIEGVFDVEAKCFGYLGQAREIKTYKYDGSYNGKIATPNGTRTGGQANNYDETIRHCHDEARLRYEFYDTNDELMKEFEMDSFRPTKRRQAFVIGYNSLSIPPGTRRIRVHMLFRRHDREFSYSHERATFVKQYLCGVHAVNIRIFINKDGLKFPSVKFNPDDVIDSELDDLIEQQIMDAQTEIVKCNDLIEDVGNIEVRNSITSNYKYPTQRGVKQSGLYHLAKWCKEEHQRLGGGGFNSFGPFGGMVTGVGSVQQPRPLPGKPGSDYHNAGRVTNISQGPTTVESSPLHSGTILSDFSSKINGFTGTQTQRAVASLSGRVNTITSEYATLGHKLIHQINFYYKRDDILTAIKEAWEDDNPEPKTPWWETQWRRYVWNPEGTGGCQTSAHIQNLVGCIMGDKYDGVYSSRTIDSRVTMAFALATLSVGSISNEANNYPRSLKYLFFRPTKHTGYSSSYPLTILGGLSVDTETTVANPPSWNFLGTNLSSMNSFYSSAQFSSIGTYQQFIPYLGTWQNTFGRYHEKNGNSFSLYNKPQHNYPHWISPSYFAAFISQLDSYGEARVYDDTIQMTIREIYDSVYDADYSNAIYPDSVRTFVPPSGFSSRHWQKPNPDDPDTWNNLDEAGDKKESILARNSDLSESGNGSFTYAMVNQGNYKIGFSYPCEVIDNNPVSLSAGNNNRILSDKDADVSKIIWPQITYWRWFQHRDLMYDMNRYTVMDYSLDDMVDKINDIPALKIFFESTRSPIIFNEKISTRPVPFDGKKTGDFRFQDSTRKNTWHGFYSQYQHMVDHLILDHPGGDNNGESFAYLQSNTFKEHKGLCVPEFYKKTVLSGDTDNMPEDAPFRYQGANPVKCLTDYENTDGLTDFSIDKMNNLGLSSSSASARLDKLLRTYAMAFARKYLLHKRVKWLNEQLQEALDWVDTQGDEYGYDQTQTAVVDD